MQSKHKWWKTTKTRLAQTLKCYLVAMLYKFFEGTCLKNRKKCWERLDVNWFRGQDSMNKQGFWGWSGYQSLVPLALEYQRFASIRAWADENHKLFSLERAIWLWRCRLPCLYFGEEILFEKKKKSSSGEIFGYFK